MPAVTRRQAQAGLELRERHVEVHPRDQFASGLRAHDRVAFVPGAVSTSAPWPARAEAIAQPVVPPDRRGRTADPRRPDARRARCCPPPPSPGPLGSPHHSPAPIGGLPPAGARPSGFGCTPARGGTAPCRGSTPARSQADLPLARHGATGAAWAGAQRPRPLRRADSHAEPRTM